MTLFLFVGGAFAYIQFIQVAELDVLQTSYNEKQKDFNSKKATSNAFPELNERYESALSIIENYDKSLFKGPNPDDVYDYLNYISNSSTSSKVYFDYVFTDSTAEDQYGIMQSDINGYGTFANVMNFINKIENSQLLNKITGLSLTPPTVGDSTLDEITFGFVVQSYYERIPIQDGPTYSSKLTLNEGISTYNPFFPLIQSSVPPNVDNLINAESSRLIGLTGSRIFLVDQGGNVLSLRMGDKVYLGKLETIDLKSKSATFNLNKGGIKELVTLEIER